MRRHIDLAQSNRDLIEHDTGGREFGAGRDLLLVSAKRDSLILGSR
jgi:hypothetical protein